MMTLDEALAKYPGAVAFSFGDSPHLQRQIIALVRSGRKTVTCDALEAFAKRGEALPKPGRVDIVRGPDGGAACAVRTTEVLHMPFEEVSDDLVRDHGEFASVAAWRVGYEAELRRAGVFRPGLTMLVERFELVEDFADA